MLMTWMVEDDLADGSGDRIVTPFSLDYDDTPPCLQGASEERTNDRADSYNLENRERHRSSARVHDGILRELSRCNKH